MVGAGVVQPFQRSERPSLLETPPVSVVRNATAARETAWVFQPNTTVSFGYRWSYNGLLSRKHRYRHKTTSNTTTKKNLLVRVCNEVLKSAEFKEGFDDERISNNC